MPIPHFSYQNHKKIEQNPNKKYYLGRQNNNENANWFKRNLKMITLGLLACFVISIIFVLFISKDLPDPNKLMAREIAQSTKIYDRTGKTVLYEISGDQKRTLVTLNDIPLNVRNATVAIEDKDFYKHGGFSLWAIFRTAVTNIIKQQKAGGSTLTQQFVKNAILTNEKTYTRKIKELILAYRLEKKFSKDQVLQMYLNEIPYGSTAYGVEAASQRYFGKSVKDVNLAEAAILASIPQAPSRYSPYGPNKDRLITRQHYVLDQMVKQNYITQDEADAAKKVELVFKKPSDNILAPHFVMYVKEILSDKYGEKTIEQGGLKITTSLDLEKQKIAEEVITEKTKDHETKYGATNAALVSIDPKTGQVLAMVGSKDYFSETIDGQVNIVTSPRQPGSSFKPMVYAASFIKGYTPNTILYDVVTNFSTDPENKYEPKNYNGAEHGPVTIKKALAGSLNIPAVKAIYLTGIDNVIKLANDMGYSTLKDKDRFGLSLVLGGGEVSLLEHANAYSAFAREGEIHNINPIIKVEDKEGKVLEEFKDQSRKIFEPEIARQISNILSDNGARAYIFGTRNSLTMSDRVVAAKTGTTNDYKDAWTLGYTPSLVTGVWVGNNDATSMKKGADGSVIAAPIWQAFMTNALKGTPVENFKSPENIKTGKAMLDGLASTSEIVKIDRASGLLATEYTPASFIEERNYGQPHSILYYINKDDPRGSAPTNPGQDPQFNSWESAVQAWAKKKNLLSSTTPPTEKDNLHLPENRPNFTIDEPANNQSIVSPWLNVKISATAPRGINRAEYYIDNTLLSTISSYPFNLDKDISFLENGYHELNVRVCDDIDNCSEQKISFNLALTGERNAVTPTMQWSDDSQITSVKNTPLILELINTNYQLIAKINLFYKQTNKETLITSVAPIESENTTINWQKTPPPGKYQLYAEAKLWNGSSIKTEERTLNIIEDKNNTASSTKKTGQ